LTLARDAQKEFLIGQSSRSHATYRRPNSGSTVIRMFPVEIRNLESYRISKVVAVRKKNNSLRINRRTKIHLGL